MLNIANYCGYANQNYSEVYFSQVRRDIIKIWQIANAWESMEKKQPSYTVSQV